MNTDGSGQTQITFKEGGYPLFASPEGKWVYYHHGLQRMLWRVSTTGGDTEELVLNKEKYYFAFSPDGSRAAFAETPSKEKTIAIVSLADGRTLKAIKAADQQSAMTEQEWLPEQLWLTELEWLPDGKGLAYVEIDSEYDKHLWVHSLALETSKKIADLGDSRISSLALSPDGKTFAVAKGIYKNNLFLLKGLK